MDKIDGDNGDILNLDRRRCFKRREEFMHNATSKAADLRSLLDDALARIQQCSGSERQIVAFALHDLLQEISPSVQERLERILAHDRED